MRRPVCWAGRVALGTSRYNEPPVHVTVEARDPAAAVKRAVAEAGERLTRGTPVDRVTVTLTRIRIPAAVASMLAGILVLAGCAAPTAPSRLVSPELRADLFACERAGRDVRQALGGIGPNVLRSADSMAQRAFERCMYARGWKLRGE